MSAQHSEQLQPLHHSFDYESKWWLPVPAAFPQNGDTDVLAWADRLALAYPIGKPWSDEPLRGQLSDLLALQYFQLSSERSAALWYCPFGLPAAGYVEFFIEPRSDGSLLAPESYLLGLRSDIQIRPERVSTVKLGQGAGYSRILDGVAEIGYVFSPANATVRIIARSADPAALAAMSAELWTIVDSLAVGASREEVK